MGTSEWKTQEVAKALERETRAEWFNSVIRQQSEETIATLLQDDMIRETECIDLVLLFLFTCFDLLGCLWKGSNSSANAVEFMREYVGRQDPRYREVSGLLYDALRHGMVHLGTPKRIELRGGSVLDFSFILSRKQGGHLEVATRDRREPQGTVHMHMLALNLPILIQDLYCAMDAYCEDIRQDQAVSDSFWKTFQARRKAEQATEKDLRRKSYMMDSDFRFVRNRT